MAMAELVAIIRGILRNLYFSEIKPQMFTLLKTLLRWIIKIIDQRFTRMNALQRRTWNNTAQKRSAACSKTLVSGVSRERNLMMISDIFVN